MALDFSNAFDVLSDTGVWINAGFVAGGYMVPWAADTATGTNLPPEVFGLAGMAVGEMVVSDRMFTVGSGLYVLKSAGDRFNAQGMVEEVLA